MGRFVPLSIPNFEGNERKYVDEIEDPRERAIIILRYGLNGKAPMKQSEIAEFYNISRSYVSRIETKSLKKLRKRFEDDKLI